MAAEHPFRREDRYSYSIDDWVTEFGQIYGQKNRSRSLTSIWMHAVEHTSELHEDMRLNRYHTALDHLADTFCWIFGFVDQAPSRYSHDGYQMTPLLSDIVFWKFPRVCYYCVQEKCICSLLVGIGIEKPDKKIELEQHNSATLMSIRARLALEIDPRNGKPNTYPMLVEMFTQMYSHLNRALVIDNIAAHFQEEVGEVAECINVLRDKGRQTTYVDHSGSHQPYIHKLETELADIVSWTVALTTKIDYLLGATVGYLTAKNVVLPNHITNPAAETQSAGVNIVDAIWDRYSEGGPMLRCRHCKKRPCICQVSDDPANALL